MVEDLQRIHEMREKLRQLGISDEDMLKLWKAALDTADKIVKES